MGINVIAKKRDENYIFIKTNMEIIFTIAQYIVMLYKFKKKETRNISVNSTCRSAYKSMLLRELRFIN